MTVPTFPQLRDRIARAANIASAAEVLNSESEWLCAAHEYLGIAESMLLAGAGLQASEHYLNAVRCAYRARDKTLLFKLTSNRTMRRILRAIRCELERGDLTPPRMER